MNAGSRRNGLGVDLGERFRKLGLEPRISLVLFILLALLVGVVHASQGAEPVAVSLVQLIASPKDYDGKFVRVIGFVRLEFEGSAIYLHQEDYLHGLTRNGLWIDVTDDIRKRRAEFDLKYVLVEGTFNAKETGHMGLWSGSIQKITRFQAWSDKGGRR